LLVAVLGVLSTAVLFGQFSDDGNAGVGTEAQRADEAITAARPEAGQALVLLSDALPPQVGALSTDLAALADIASVTLDETSGTSTLLRVDLAPGLSDDDRATVAEQVEKVAHRDVPGSKVLSEELVNRDFETILGQDLPKAEGIGLLTALIVLTVVLGWRAALIPLVAGLATIIGAMPVLLVIALTVPVMSHALNIAILLGLGLALDYGLLLLARYRQARADGVEHEAAVELARARAGRTILWSAATVVVTLSALLLFRDGPFLAVTAGGIAATVVAVLAAGTLAPAMLRAWGPKLRPARARTRESRFGRLAGVAQRNPGRVTVASCLLLVALALPLVGARFVEGGIDMLPADAPSRQANTALATDFPGFGTAVVEVVAPSDQAMAAFAPAVEALPGVDSVEVDGRVATVRTGGDSEGAEATAVVQRVRDAAPDCVLVGGDAAFRHDHLEQLAWRLPTVLAALSLLTGALVFGLTRSLKQAVVAPALALLSQGATLGILSLLFGGALVVYSPIIAAALAFALSLDYLIFLLHRAREERQQGAAPDRAVRSALGSTGQVITLAAVIFSGVSIGFATSRIGLTHQLGVAMVIGVLLDATLVRCLLLPAALAWRPIAARRAPQAAVGAATRVATAAAVSPGTTPATTAGVSRVTVPFDQAPRS
jgi:RND superfamily putative drug exporter